MRLFPTGCLFLSLLAPLGLGQTTQNSSLRVELSWGHRSDVSRDYLVKVAGHDLTISNLELVEAEVSDKLQEAAARTKAGRGDVDGLSFMLEFATRSIKPITNAQEIWTHLLQHGDPGAARRLQADPAWRPDSRRVTFRLNEEGTRGFSLSVDQLLTQKAFWFPEFDLFLYAGEPGVSFATYEKELEPQAGQRVLDRVDREPEATYQQFAERWEDMGSATYQNSKSIPPGHIVGVGWDSGLYKFGIDRFARVRNDYSKQDVFNFGFLFTDPYKAWKGQKLADGLPIILSTFEEGGTQYKVEQFAAPLAGPPKERRGDISMVMVQRISFRELTGESRLVALPMSLERELGAPLSIRREGHAFIVGNEDVTCLVVEGEGITVELKSEGKKSIVTVSLELRANETRDVIVKLPSPLVSSKDTATLLALDYARNRAITEKFWNDYLAQGTFFQVPDEAVNTLFRANLWHALRLPRRHGGAEPDVKIDLPYSNFAYDQKGTPWPVNQSVYVDYMLYDLRGYHAVSAEELAAMYRNNQESDGQVGGFASWGVYTPGMLYSVAQHYLLSGDRKSFEALLPQTLRALDWCLGEIKRASDPANPAPGLVLAPLNDLSHDTKSWAFNQAYMVAGVDLLGRALAEIEHPRAPECQVAAEMMRRAVEREFGRASVRSPAVQLGDGTWSPYVPCDAQASGRLFQVWYPTDVDTGPLHLSRLKALDPRGALTTAMLHDHEDNLFINQWGMINEPVYNQQATAYLDRDEPKRAIRSFYSMLACAFSHSVFEPVEHRWGWGQYFGPPSTDGAWFELYRNMLIHEREDGALLLAQATPRAWLEKGKQIEVRKAPTYFGEVSFTMQSDERAGEVKAVVSLPSRKRPTELLVRFRHPEEKVIRSVSVNGANWTDFDVKREWVRIPKPTENSYTIITHY